MQASELTVLGIFYLLYSKERSHLTALTGLAIRSKFLL